MLKPISILLLAAGLLFPALRAEAVVLHLFMPDGAKKLFEEPRGISATSLNFVMEKPFPEQLVTREAVRKRLGSSWEECLVDGAAGWVSFRDKTTGVTKYRYQIATYYRKGTQVFILVNRFLDDVIPPDDEKSSRPVTTQQEAVLRITEMPDDEFGKFARESKLKCSKY